MENRRNWADRVSRYEDFVIDMIQSNNLGAYFTKYNLDLDDMERRIRHLKNFKIEDLTELAPGETLDLNSPDCHVYQKFKGAAAAIMLAAYAKSRGLISLETFNGIVYNEGPASNYAHMTDSIKILAFGREHEITHEEKLELFNAVEEFVNACVESALDPNSYLCRAVVESGKTAFSKAP